jgi:hypothetical protein
MSDAPNLPVPLEARLPVTYETAQKALAECERIDECKKWTDKAAALASYAKQAKDNSLHQLALRIQARAVRRCGELLKQVEPAQGGDRGNSATGGRPPVGSRKAAAESAGLSEHQRKTALRVATIPAEDFDYAVESQDPPTITELAEQGTVSCEGESARKDESAQTVTENYEPGQGICAPVRARADEADHGQALEAFGKFKAFADFCDTHDPAELARLMPVEHAGTLRRFVQLADGWLDRFVTNLPDVERA